MKEGKIAVIEEEAELVRLIFQRYLELGSVNELVRDLKERNIRTRAKQLATGATRGGIPFGRGALYYLLSNHFYIGEVKYRNEILPGKQPPIMDRALFDAVRQKSRDWLADCRACLLRPLKVGRADLMRRSLVSCPSHGECRE